MLGLKKLGIRTVLDIGANAGQFAAGARSILPEARFYCFEPLRGPFGELQRWARQQASGSVTAFNLALGCHDGTARMFEHTNHSPSSSLLASTSLTAKLYPQTRPQAVTEVRVARLDGFIAESGLDLPPPILVKMDVQGYEQRVIEGGKETLARARACIIEVSFDKLYEDQSTFKDIWQILDTLGYRFVGNLEQFCATDGHVVFADAVFVR